MDLELGLGHFLGEKNLRSEVRKAERSILKLLIGF